MAQVTELSLMAIPGGLHSFVAKTEAVGVVVSDRYGLIGTSDEKFDLTGADNNKPTLIGTDDSKFDLTGI